MAGTFDYDHDVIKDSYRLWRASDYMPNRRQRDTFIVMQADERHTFINDLVAFESMEKIMKLMSPLIQDRIKQLVAKHLYDAARKLAKQYPDDPAAQQYLRDIDTLETPVERGAKSAMKYAAYAALIFLAIMILITVFTIVWLNRQ